MHVGQQLLHCRIDFRILQSPLSILHNYTESKTFFPWLDAFSGVNVEQFDLLDEGRPVGQNAVEQGLKFEFLIDHDGHVAQCGRLFRNLAVGRQARGQDGGEVEFTDDRGERQFVVLDPLRVQLADHADSLAVDQDAGAAAGV